MENSVFTPDPTIANMVPITQTRTVSYEVNFSNNFQRTQGIAESSVLDTAALTSS